MNRLSGILATLDTSVSMLKDHSQGPAAAARLLALHLSPSPAEAMEFVRAYSLAVRRRVPNRVNYYLTRVAEWNPRTPYPFSTAESEALTSLLSEFVDWLKEKPSRLDHES